MKNSLGLQLESEQRNFPDFRWGGKSGKFYRKRDCEGFTLVELIVVIVILAILAAILVPGLLGWIDKAKLSKYELEARSIAQAAQAEVAEFYAKGGVPKGNLVWFADDDKAEKEGLKKIKELSGIDSIKSVYVYCKDIINGNDWTIESMWIMYTTDGKNMYAVWHVNKLPDDERNAIKGVHGDALKGSEEGWVFVENAF